MNNTVAKLGEKKSKSTSPALGTKPARAADVATLTDLLRETAEHHDHYEKTHAEHNWWDWYAPYLSSRQNGSSSEKAADAADRYMEGVFHVVPR